MAFYITTPIYYVNAAPHLGHAYSTIGADIVARHHRQRGEDVFFLTGTDEHGEPVAQAAEKEGVTPIELADRNAKRFQDLLPVVNASNDFFIRTTDPRHHAGVQQVMQRVHDNGYAYKGHYEGWYCPRCADFKSDAEQGPDHTCPIHKIPLDRESEENWFFQLSAFQDRLEQLYADRPEFVLPGTRYNEARSFITGGLQDVSLSRNKAKLTWGVTVPWDEEHVFYVWFDALLNYYTALGFANENEDLTDRYWPATLHWMAKDILKFHTVFWPALLMAADLPVPEQIFVHGYLLTAPDEKMSKSRGTTIDPIAVAEELGADALRFYCAREVTFGSDGVVSLDGLRARYETELANDYGNLASRTLAMVTRYRDGVVPDVAVDPVLAEDFKDLKEQVSAHFDRAEITQALELIWVRVRRLNRYVEEQTPWVLAKDEARSQELDVCLRSLAEGLRVVTVLLAAYMPASTSTLLAAMGQPDAISLDAAVFGERPGGNRVEKLAPLFPKHDTPK